MAQRIRSPAAPSWKRRLPPPARLRALNWDFVDDVIEPAFTRQMVAAALNMLESKRTIKPAERQGNLPL